MFCLQPSGSVCVSGGMSRWCTMSTDLTDVSVTQTSQVESSHDKRVSIGVGLVGAVDWGPHDYGHLWSHPVVLRVIYKILQTISVLKSSSAIYRCLPFIIKSCLHKSTSRQALARRVTIQSYRMYYKMYCYKVSWNSSVVLPVISA